MHRFPLASRWRDKRPIVYTKIDGGVKRYSLLFSHSPLTVPAAMSAILCVGSFNVRTTTGCVVAECLAIRWADNAGRIVDTRPAQGYPWSIKGRALRTEGNRPLPGGGLQT